MRKQLIFPVVLSALLASCASHDNKHSPSEADSASIESTAAQPDGTIVPPYYKAIGDSLEIPPVEIQLDLSAAANEKLRNATETVIIAAYYSGQPKDTTSEEYLESGQLSVVTHLEELHDERNVKIEHVRFARSRYDSLASKDIELLINVYSGRRSTDVNILDCDILQDSMSVLKGNKYVIKGKLIGE